MKPAIIYVYCGEWGLWGVESWEWGVGVESWEWGVGSGCRKKGVRLQESVRLKCGKV